MRTPVLRPGRPKEAADMLEVMIAALDGETTSGAMPHPFPDPLRETAWLCYLLESGTGWVAEEDGRLAGFGISAWRGSIHWLVSLFVRPEAQRRGLGRLLLEQLWPPASSEPRATLVDAASRSATSLYLRAGLVPRFPVLAFDGRIDPEGTHTGRLAARDDWQDVRQRVADLDAAVHGSARPADHDHWSTSGLAYRSLWSAAGDWLGYGRWSLGGRLGPVVLADEVDWVAALSALAAAARRTGIDRLRLMAPVVNTGALQACQNLGMRYQGSELAIATCSLQSWSRYLIHRAGLP